MAKFDKFFSVFGNTRVGENGALKSVFQNLRISSYQWKRKAKFENFSPNSQMGQWKRGLSVNLILYCYKKLCMNDEAQTNFRCRRV